MIKNFQHHRKECLFVIQLASTYSLLFDTVGTYCTIPFTIEKLNTSGHMAPFYLHGMVILQMKLELI
jgi:hypothetical protein